MSVVMCVRLLEYDLSFMYDNEFECKCLRVRELVPGDLYVL